MVSDVVPLNAVESMERHLSRMTIVLSFEQPAKARSLIDSMLSGSITVTASHLRNALASIAVTSLPPIFAGTMTLSLPEPTYAVICTLPPMIVYLRSSYFSSSPVEPPVSEVNVTFEAVFAKVSAVEPLYPFIVKGEQR